MNALLSVLLLVAGVGCGESAKPGWHGNALEIQMLALHPMMLLRPNKTEPFPVTVICPDPS
jgi:hypothetical protein